MQQRRGHTGATTTAPNCNDASTTDATSPTTTASSFLSRRRRLRRNLRLYSRLPTARLLTAVASCLLLVVTLCILSRVLLRPTTEPGRSHFFRLDRIKAFKKPPKELVLDPHEFAAEQYSEELILPYNPIYRVKDVMPIVGDRSDRYAKFRQEIDPLFPEDLTRTNEVVRRLQQTTHFYSPLPMDPHNSDQVPYDIYDCPDTPPTGYPFAWNLVQILENWPVDDPTPRPGIHQGVCVFDYTKDYHKAMTYRTAELPFVVVNDPVVHQTVERWNAPGYMARLLSDGPHRCEYSANNHFMYFVPQPKNKNKRVPSDWKPPTELLRMNYNEWLAHANVTDEFLGPDQPHWYYRLIGCGMMGNKGTCDRGASEYLFDELPFMQPKKSLYMVDPSEQKGIHCRFGMKGVIAENHFDGSRNTIAVLGGSRRYILSHPNQCDKLALYPKGHPSARHSAVDWSRPDLNQFPQFAQAASNEVVLQAGHVLYLPTNWFHYIVSLELNFQCNTRSGISTEYMPPLRKCGF